MFLYLQVQGLCGNRDGIIDQQFVLRNGLTTMSVDRFGAAYEIATGTCDPRRTPSPVKDTCVVSPKVSDLNFSTLGLRLI